MASVYFRFWKTFDLGYRTTLICTFVLSLYSGILSPSKKKAHTHIVKTRLWEAFLQRLITPASATCSFSHHSLVLTLSWDQRPWWWMNFSPAEQGKDGEHCTDMAQTTANPLWGFGSCNCSCVESLPVVPVCREPLLVNWPIFSWLNGKQDPLLVEK